MNAAPPTALSPDQEHVFRTAQAWRDFRAHFRTYEEALEAHVLGASLFLRGDAEPTHELQWRHIYHDRASKLRQLFALLLVPLGQLSAHHAEFRFTTVHAFTPHEARSLFWGRALASLAYHAAFFVGILCGVGTFVAGIMLAMADSGPKEITALVVAIAGFIGAMVGAAKSRQIGLPDSLRPIAKDAFDLWSIRRIKPKRTS